jgi:hypothetical protein
MMSTLDCLRLEGYRGTRCETLSSLIRHLIPSTQAYSLSGQSYRLCLPPGGAELATLSLYFGFSHPLESIP